MANTKSKREEAIQENLEQTVSSTEKFFTKYRQHLFDLHSVFYFITMIKYQCSNLFYSFVIIVQTLHYAFCHFTA